MKAITYIPTGAGLLPAALKLDAVVTGANGAAYLALGGPLGDLLDVPASTLRVLGALLLVFAIGVSAVAARPHRAAVSAVIGANELWVAASIVVLIADTWTPSTARDRGRVRRPSAHRSAANARSGTLLNIRSSISPCSSDQVRPTPSRVATSP